MVRARLSVLFGVVASLLTTVTRAPAHHFEIGPTDFLLDGAKVQIRCGEIHAARVPRDYWRQRLQMAHAMGLNTVCAYLFWNYHEPRPGHFEWAGGKDMAEFCRIAQQEGLWVILRPGPYSCAEWEMGGLPWWLLQDSNIHLRSRDPAYLAAARRWLAEVGRVFAPLQVTRGGPILMVQVENEYGSYGQDAGYMGEMRAAMVAAGFDVPLFACNPVQHLQNGWRDDLFAVVNFGSDPTGAFQALRALQPRGPLMCGEFYPGWFDTWGAPHHRGSPARYLADLDTMLRMGTSFSIYMAHGGTTFGLWAGADRPFRPDTSSYDYDAPISEAGWVTEKFWQTRELMARYLQPGETLPDPPAAPPVQAFAPARAQHFASLWTALPAPLSREQPENFETLDHGFGLVVYRTVMPVGPAGTLEAASVHDFGFVFLDGKRLGVMDRRQNAYRINIPARMRPAVLDILVEAMGRVNFGVEVHDHKGLRAPVTFTPAGKGETEVKGWQIYPLALDEALFDRLQYATPAASAGPGFWCLNIDLPAAADTFLDLRTWNKGIVWVNGHCLGRFWNIGPTQTMFAPGPWLRRGANEVVVLDLVGPTDPMIGGLERPVLDELRPALDFTPVRRPEMTLVLRGLAPAQEGEFAAGSTAQTIRFAPHRGRQFCLEAIDAFGRARDAAIAELELLNPAGRPVPHEGWKVAYVDSEELNREDGSAENAIDGQTSDQWHTRVSGDAPPGYPHRLVLDLGAEREIGGIRYTPRQGDAAVGGRIKRFRLFVGDGLAVR